MRGDAGCVRCVVAALATIAAAVGMAAAIVFLNPDGTVSPLVVPAVLLAMGFWVFRWLEWLKPGWRR